MKKILSLIIVIILCMVLLCACAPKEAPALTVDLLKIGQADAFVLKTPSHAILIDTGEEDDGSDEQPPEEEKTGCGASVALGGIAMIVMALSLGVSVLKKR